MKYGIFICSHGRPNKQLTVKSLREAGYNGDIWLILDDEDDTLSEYNKQIDSWHDENIFCHIFNKQHYVDTVDIGIQSSKARRKVILYAKCACEDFAKERGYDCFGIADDDFTGFRYRYGEDGKLKSLNLTSSLDTVFEIYFQFLMDNNICMTSIGTNQMFMGGVPSEDKLCNLRVPFSFVFRNVSIPFEWKSEMIEDVISATTQGMIGKYMLQMPFIQLKLLPCFAGADGGMTDVYQSMSEFQKNFSVVQYLPSCVKIIANSYNVTHRLIRDNAFPKLVSSNFKIK